GYNARSRSCAVSWDERPARNGKSRPLEDKRSVWATRKNSLPVLFVREDRDSCLARTGSLVSGLGQADGLVQIRQRDAVNNFGNIRYAIGYHATPLSRRVEDRTPQARRFAGQPQPFEEPSAAQEHFGPPGSREAHILFEFTFSPIRIADNPDFFAPV